MSKLKEIVADIKELKVIEVTELVEMLQEEFGVSSLATTSIQQENSSDESKSEEKTTFKLELVDIGAEKIKVIKALRQIKKDLGLIEAKNATENLPFVVLTDSTREDVDSAKKTLEDAGAKVKVS
jgi:large subunit ribosomal protein L7/L12